MNILILGSGGREHALAWKAAQSPLVARVCVAPGNAGSAAEPKVENVALSADAIPDLVKFATEKKIALTIVGPEAPLVAGVSDAFAENGLKCFGPSAQGAQLEGSKIFAKDFLRRHNIPTAAYAQFDQPAPALAYLKTVQYPVVVKADGLAAGKGVVIAATEAEAVATVDAMLTAKRFGDAGSRVVIEKFLRGEEASFMCIVDGEDVLPLASSQDHKAAFDGDRGPNTGGMGAYSPAPLVNDAMHRRIVQTIIRPTLRGLAQDGIAYTGFLYAGLMIDEAGAPKVLEFNCRLGDPETQPILLRLQSDLVAHCLAAVEGRLAAEVAQWDERCALGVVLAARGYPGDYATGQVMNIVTPPPPHKVFHAGSKTENGQTVVAGGRVLCVTALEHSVQAAADAAYQAAAEISWDGCWYRRDIGHRAITRGA